MLKSRAQILVEEMKETINHAMKMAGGIGFIEDMNADTFVMLQSYMRLAKNCEEYLIEEAAQMDRIEEKLDRLLSKNKE